jgi:3-deoxy-manno-octulosonate cytidylyltransferase (CMP-KDO synthetase)
MRVAAVIPARMQSTRLPGKPLALIAGVPMIVRVLERVRIAGGIDRTIVATDHPEIVSTVEAAGGEAWLTSASHATGSDRVAEVAAALDHDFILNVQGDEPLLPVSTVTALLGRAAEGDVDTVVTACIPFRTEAEAVNPNIVKVVLSQRGRALYFSRYPIPYRRGGPLNLSEAREDPDTGGECRKHIGIYLYNRQFLLRYVDLPRTPLERSEALEQLRILEHGYSIDVVEVAEDSVSVDTPADLEEVEALLGFRR